MNNQNSNDLSEIIARALNEMKLEAGDSFDLEKVNLAELERRTKISRKKLRKIKEDGFVIKPHGLLGTQKTNTVLSGFTDTIDSLLKRGVSNSSVIQERLKEMGYTGSKTQLKVYIKKHESLIPAKRKLVTSQGNRGRRYRTDPGETYQMDWGFVTVECASGATYQAACFVMICHCCGERYVEFFPNAKQENLFIGMMHAFQALGIPRYVLTDNMKSIVNGRDSLGHPLWNAEYMDFMKAVGFETKLCRPRHPFTKGAVERLVYFVKQNFMAGRVFGNITDLNYEVHRWCDRQNHRYHEGVNCIPAEVHEDRCLRSSRELQMTDSLQLYLWPERRISFDGFINYEGRRFGVPYWYTGKTCRVSRQDFTLYIYTPDLSRKLTEHNVTWSKHDAFCEDQYASEQPEEFPTAPVSVRMHQTQTAKTPFTDFNFDREVEW